MDFIEITYRNSLGGLIVFSDYFEPFVFTKFEPSGTNNTVQSVQSPFQDGSLPVGSRLESLPLPLEFDIYAKSSEELKEFKKKIYSVINPKIPSGIITYKEGSIIREIEVQIERIPYFPSGKDNRIGSYQKCVIDFIALFPYWRDITDSKKSLAAYRESLTLPFELPVTMGVEGESTIIMNDGHVETPIEIRFSGPSVNPVIQNQSTGELIKINRTLEMGDVLYINTSPGNEKRVEIQRSDGSIEDAFHWIDIFESTLFNLVPGENYLVYKADSGTEEAIVSISYRNLYYGV
jgi:Phage tail protein